MSKKKNKPDKYWKDELQRLLNILANRDNGEEPEEVPTEEDQPPQCLGTEQLFKICYFGADLYTTNINIGNLVTHVDPVIGPKPVGLVVNVTDMGEHMGIDGKQKYWVFVFIDGGIWGDWADYWEPAVNYFG